MIDNIKLLLDINDNSKDSLLNFLIEFCSQQALDYTHLKELDNSLNYIVVLMVVESYNKIGSEGIASKSYSGISETPIDGYSSNVLKLLKSKRKIRTVK